MVKVLQSQGEDPKLYLSSQTQEMLEDEEYNEALKKKYQFTKC